jgi:hypothetical protein
MKKLILTLALTGAAFAATSPQTFVGEISDSQCALNVHSKTGSHKEMTVNHTMGNTEAECVEACVRSGGQYVLVTPKKIFKLSDQKQPAGFPARRVKVQGTLDEKTGTIQVQSITAAD